MDRQCVSEDGPVDSRPCERGRTFETGRKCQPFSPGSDDTQPVTNLRFHRSRQCIQCARSIGLFRKLVGGHRNGEQGAITRQTSGVVEYRRNGVGFVCAEVVTEQCDVPGGRPNERIAEIEQAGEPDTGFGMASCTAVVRLVDPVRADVRRLVPRLLAMILAVASQTATARSLVVTVSVIFPRSLSAPPSAISPAVVIRSVVADEEVLDVQIGMDQAPAPVGSGADVVLQPCQVGDHGRVEPGDRVVSESASVERPDRGVEPTVDDAVRRVGAHPDQTIGSILQWSPPGCSVDEAMTCIERVGDVINELARPRLSGHDGPSG